MTAFQGHSMINTSIVLRSKSSHVSNTVQKVYDKEAINVNVKLWNGSTIEAPERGKFIVLGK